MQKHITSPKSLLSFIFKFFLCLANMYFDRPQIKEMIKLSLCHILLLSFAKIGSLYSQQPPLMCGAIENINGIVPSGAPIFFDRFGNQYGEEELSLDNLNNIQLNHCDQIEDFTLIFENTQMMYPFTQPEMETICDVFEYLSQVIIAPSGHRAIIRISKDPNLANGVAAVATTYFPNQCGLGHSMVHQQFFAGSVNSIVHGEIDINPNGNFYIGPESGIQSTTYDFYTVILHEALHVLGFGSRIIPPNGNSINGFYSLWDLNLVGTTGQHLISTTPAPSDESCCAIYAFNSQQFPNMPDVIWDQDCGPNNIRFDVSQMPPVNAEYPNFPQSPEIFLNVLSHLDRQCGTEHYVMNGSIPAGTDGIQRVLTNSETDILCKLGYSIQGSCGQACLIIAADDGPLTRGTGFSSLNTSDFLSNDFFTSNIVIGFPAGCGDNDLFNPELIGLTGVSINPTGTILPGMYEICYTLTGCDGSMCHKATLTLFLFDDTGDTGNFANSCDPNNCELELVCNGDFNAYIAKGGYFNFQAGLPVWTSPTVASNATVDNSYILGSNNDIVTSWGNWDNSMAPGLGTEVFYIL